MFMSRSSMSPDDSRRHVCLRHTHQTTFTGALFTFVSRGFAHLLRTSDETKTKYTFIGAPIPACRALRSATTSPTTETSTSELPALPSCHPPNHIPYPVQLPMGRRHMLLRDPQARSPEHPSRARRHEHPRRRRRALLAQAALEVAPNDARDLAFRARPRFRRT